MSLEVVEIQRRRLRQLFWMTEVVIVTIFIKTWFEEEYLNAGMLAFTVVGGLLVPYLMYLGRQTAASALFSLLLCSLVLIIMWTSTGFKNNAVVALPALLVFIALIGGHQFFRPMVVFIIANILLMGWFTDVGWYHPRLSTHDMSSAYDIATILALTAVAVHFISQDNTRLIAGMRKEISKVQQSHKEMSYLANHDTLTGLPNRSAAEMAFATMINRLVRSREKFAAVFFIDLDEFKEVNDTLGHDVGDQYLVQISLGLSSVLRSTDQLFRIGGDEFLVYLENFQDIDNLVSVAEKIRIRLQEPVEIDQNTIKCSGSIGMIVLPTDADTYNEAVKRADIAMYRSKEQGKNCFQFYDPEMEQELLDRIAFQNDMQASLINRDFRVQFQPIVDIKTGEIIGAEALLRWHHPDKGLIGPVKFIPIAEKSDLINDLSRFVLEETCTLLTEVLPDQPDFYISVNLSPVQLKFPGLVGRIVTPRAQELAANIKLEVTESQIIDNMDTFLQNVNAIRSLGFGLFLDDFGTGYSNLGHLQKLQFETLKIDRSFIHNIHNRSDQFPLLKGITNLATDLNLKVVVEGVETEDELNVLKELNITSGQGYLWSRPVDRQVLLDRIGQQNITPS